MCGTLLGNVVASAPAPSNQPPPPQLARPAITLIHSSGRQFPLTREEGYVGRRGQSSGNIPEIDLMGIPNEGVVSRAHARICWDGSQNAYMLVDNNSRNGTYLNGNHLSPKVQYRLKHGDSLQLGQHNLVSFTVSLT